MCFRSASDLHLARERLRAASAQIKKRVRICAGPGCLASGAREVAAALERAFAAKKLTVELGFEHKCTGCQGLCERGPLVIIEPEGILYGKVKPGDAEEIVAASVQGDALVSRLCYRDSASHEAIARAADIPFYRGQKRQVLSRMGVVDPTSLDDALAHGAYSGLERTLCSLSPEAVITTIADAGLRGRGGAGFPTARKWTAARRAVATSRVVICNGDEGDPGAFKDRALMEGDPHSIIEGMIIGAFAIGATAGYIYVRDEYPLAIAHLTLALEQARARGLLGDRILGSALSFDIKIARGGGAFVCGESSALMRAIEGKVGEPRQKYTHATANGLFNQPTVLNNVETWASVTAILEQGALAFASLGTSSSKGTKAFSLAGALKNTGLAELPMGTTLRQIVYDIGGGMRNDRPFKAIQTGGPSGGCLPASMLDLPVDYDQLTQAGSMMGSGGLIVMDDRTCMVEVARYFVAFLANESCGKCVPCREGLRQMLGIYTSIVEGQGTVADLARIERLARAMQLASLCELGKSAVNPVLATLRYFRDEYESHLVNGACPAGQCRALTGFEINATLCDGCHACVAQCPSNAIAGEVKKAHTLEVALCTGCGACLSVCKRGAVSHYSKRERQLEAV